MRVDGKRIAKDIYARLPKKRAVLGIVVASHTPVIESFVRIKSRAAERIGVELRRIDLLARPATEDAVAAIEGLAPEVDGVIVQLPLPDPLDTERVLAAIPPYLDVDGINPTVSDEAKAVRSPVARALEEILTECRVEVQGKRATVVGSGRLVGEPCAALLREMGALVTVLNRGDSLASLRDAQIVVLGAGEPGLVKPRMLKEGVALIDAGASESEGKVAGDADPACEAVSSVFTPVPGGVGPVAVAMIFKNLFDLMEQQNAPAR